MKKIDTKIVSVSDWFTIEIAFEFLTSNYFHKGMSIVVSSIVEVSMNKIAL